MKRALAVLALTGSMAVLGGGAAMAADNYPAPSTTASVSSGTVAPGEAVTFSGTGFTPGEQINISVVSSGASGGTATGSRSVPVRIVLPAETTTLKTVADAKGSFSTQITLTAAGTYTLTATGATSGHSVSSTVVVAAPVVQLASAQQNGNLAQTGMDSSLALWGGIGATALALGVTSVALARNKAKTEDA